MPILKRAICFCPGRLSKSDTNWPPLDAAYWRLLAMFCSDNQFADFGYRPARRKTSRPTRTERSADPGRAGIGPIPTPACFIPPNRLYPRHQACADLALAHLHLAENYLRQGDRVSAFNELNLTVQLDHDGTAGQMAAQILKQTFP